MTEQEQQELEQLSQVTDEQFETAAMEQANAELAGEDNAPVPPATAMETFEEQPGPSVAPAEQPHEEIEQEQAAQQAEADYYAGLAPEQAEHFRALEAERQRALEDAERARRQFNGQQGQVAKMQREWQELKREKATWEAQRQTMEGEPGSYKRYPSWKKFEEGFDNPDAAEETTGTLYNGVKEVVTDEVARLQAEINDIRQQEQTRLEQMAGESYRAATNELAARHPDFRDIAAKPEWQEFKGWLGTISTQNMNYERMADSSDPVEVSAILDMYKQGQWGGSPGPSAPQPREQGPSAQQPTQPQQWGQQVQASPSAQQPTQQPAPQFQQVQTPAATQSGQLEQFRQWQLAASQSLPPAAAGMNGTVPVSQLTPQQYEDQLFAQADRELQGH